MTSSLPSFGPLEVDVNPTEWGPTTLPAHLQDVSYAPFSKGARLGALANFLEAPRGAPSRGACVFSALSALCNAPLLSCGGHRPTSASRHHPPYA